MIKREFWEKIAASWGNEEELKIPDVIIGEEIIDCDLDDYDIEGLDDFLSELLE